MNLIYRCEECGVSKPCIITMIGEKENKYPPEICPFGGLFKAKWKLLS